jgi:hypothetical protein
VGSLIFFLAVVFITFKEAFSLLMSQVGKQIVLGTLEDNFKADMLLSLSRLASKSVVLFCNQVV